MVTAVVPWDTVCLASSQVAAAGAAEPVRWPLQPVVQEGVRDAHGLGKEVCGPCLGTYNLLSGFPGATQCCRGKGRRQHGDKRQTTQGRILTEKKRREKETGGWKGQVRERTGDMARNSVWICGSCHNGQAKRAHLPGFPRP